jgi:hypothetical protein
MCEWPLRFWWQWVARLGGSIPVDDPAAMTLTGDAVRFPSATSRERVGKRALVLSVRPRLTVRFDRPRWRAAVDDEALRSRLPLPKFGCACVPSQSNLRRVDDLDRPAHQSDVVLPLRTTSSPPHRHHAAAAPQRHRPQATPDAPVASGLYSHTPLVASRHPPSCGDASRTLRADRARAFVNHSRVPHTLVRRH